MFIAPLITIAKLWKKPACSNTDEWIQKMWFLYKMEFYSAIKNEILSFAGKWMELENIILSEFSQDQKAKSHMFSLIYERNIQIHLIQIQQYYEKQVTLRGDHIREV
jgi:hypothetical protein